MHTASTNRSLVPIAVFSFLVSLAFAQSCQSRVAEPFDHDEFYVIEGLHVPVSCDGCHTDGFEGTATTCQGCHEEDRPESHAGVYVGDCSECHTPYGFLGEAPGVEQHPCMTDHDACMALVGPHLGPYCHDCHPNAASFDYTGLDSTSCSSCHEEDRDGADHYPGEDCMPCHLPTKWEDGKEHGLLYGGLFYRINYEHPSTPKYPEKEAECADCHPTSPKAWTPFTCMSGGCHPQADLETKHVVAFDYEPNACISCHITELYQAL